MAVDWSIFWNNIFPGAIVLLFSSLAAYILIYRYQRRKHKKEIKDDLLLLENNVAKKFLKLYLISLDFTSGYSKFIDLQMTGEVNKIKEYVNSFVKDKEQHKRVKETMEEKDKFLKEEQKVVRILEDTEKLQEVLESYEKVYTEFSMEVRLLMQRINLQLKLEIHQENQIEDFIEKMNKISIRVTNEIKEMTKEERFQILNKNLDELMSSFENFSRIILTSKIKT